MKLKKTVSNLPRWLDIHSSQDHEIRHPAIIFFESVNETNGVCNNLKKEPFQQTSGNNTNQLEKCNVARKKKTTTTKQCKRRVFNLYLKRSVLY